MKSVAEYLNHVMDEIDFIEKHIQNIDKKGYTAGLFSSL